MAEIDKNKHLEIFQQQLKNQKILIIDKDANSRQILQNILIKLSLNKIEIAENDKDAISIIKRIKFDIILSEFWLDGKRNGHQLLEELRYSKLLPLSTIYILVTGENNLKNVISLAELLPDDYLVKPFTAEVLKSRLIKILYKKYILKNIYQRLETNNFEGVIAACSRIQQLYPAFTMDAMRYKAEAYLRLNNYEKSYKNFNEIYSLNQNLAWAKMGMALSLKGLGNLTDAEIMASSLLKENPNFIPLYDLLTEIYIETNKPELAQKVLEQAHKLSPNSLKRQRNLAQIAMQNGDYGVAQKLFGLVIENSKDSSLFNAEDFGDLAQINLEQGDKQVLWNSKKLLNEIKKNKITFKNKNEELKFNIIDAFLLLTDKNINNTKKAIEIINNCLELIKDIKVSEPDNLNIKSISQLAVICDKAKMKDKALELIKESAMIKRKLKKR